MKPPMKQKVTAHMPVLDENGEPIRDKYDRPVTETKTSKARVQIKNNVVLDTIGSEKLANVEIDLPPAFNPEAGSQIEYVTIAGNKGSGTIISKDEATNIAGSKVYYRTVFVDG